MMDFWHVPATPQRRSLHFSVPWQLVGKTLQRRNFITMTVGALVLARPALATPTRIEVFKSPTCG
jgi:hypothetical protein